MFIYLSLTLCIGIYVQGKLLVELVGFFRDLVVTGRRGLVRQSRALKAETVARAYQARRAAGVVGGGDLEELEVDPDDE
jgi:hypothetical protein